MAPIRTQKRKKKAGKEVDPSTPPSSLQFCPCAPSDWWDDHFSRRIAVAGSSGAKFESFLKISRKTFNYICALVEEEKSANYADLGGKVLSLNDRVAIAMRRLSSGESLAAVGEMVGVHQSTVSHVTWWFVEAMEKRALHHIHWPSTVEEITELKSKFEKIRGLPNCCGAIDTTNIMFCLSTGDPSNKIWCDKENNAGMILQAIVDPEMRFLDIITGWPGGLSDTHVLQSSNFFKLSEDGRRLHGNKLKLSEGVELREYIVGDVGFPPLPWLLTPYRGRGLSEVKDNYNKRHHETWKVAKCALAKLKETWRVIQGVMWRPDKHRLPRIILVCCLLHNISIDLGDGLQDGMSFPDNNDPDHRQQNRRHHPNKAASAQRENLALYLSAKLPP